MRLFCYICFLLLIAGMLPGAGILNAQSPWNLSRPQLEEKISSFLEDVFRKEPGRVEWEPLSRINNWQIGVPFDSIVVFYKGNDLPRGHTILTLQAIAGSRAVRVLSYAVNVRIYREVLVAKEVIPRNKEIVNTAFTIEEREITRTRGTPVTGPEQIRHSITKKTISPGQILLQGYFRSPYLIERGDTVTLVYEKPQLRVALQVRALQNGAKDEVIWFSSLENNKRFKGRVMDDALAVIP